MDERRHELIERYRAARDTLAEAVAAHPEARAGDGGGRSVLIHVIGWDREAATWLPRGSAGVDGRDYADEAMWDRRFEERMAHLTDHQLRAEYEASEEALVQVLAGLPDAAFAPDGAVARWAAEWADHALDHAAEFGDIGS